MDIRIPLCKMYDWAMIGFGLDSTRLGRVGKVVGKVFRGCGRISLVVPETTIDAFLCVVGGDCDNNQNINFLRIVYTATGGGRKGRTRQKGNIPFRALFDKNVPFRLS